MFDIQINFHIIFFFSINVCLCYFLYFSILFNKIFNKSWDLCYEFFINLPFCVKFLIIYLYYCSKNKSENSNRNMEKSWKQKDSDTFFWKVSWKCHMVCGVAIFLKFLSFYRIKVTSVNYNKSLFLLNIVLHKLNFSREKELKRIYFY